MALADDLLSVLDDPAHMWTHALRELSRDAQRLFLTLVVLPKPVSIDVLQFAYTSQQIGRSESFLDSLRSIEDSFVDINKHHGSVRSVAFRNPSLQEFAYMYLEENPDLLDIILSSPVYYEQITETFALAMAHDTVIYNTHDRSKRPGPARYAGIKRWVERRADQLVSMAIDLLDSERGEFYSRVGRSRLSQLVAIMARYGAPDGVTVSNKLRAAVERAVNPRSKDAANISITLIGERSHRLILDKLIGENAAASMRANILDEDDWKYGILSKLDGILELDRDESLESWGASYLEYAHQLATDLEDSTNDEDLRDAISEITSITTMLDVDMGEEITRLEAQREALAAQDSDYQEPTGPSPVENKKSGDASSELARIFSSLL